jgi:hypothetical protein
MDMSSAKYVIILSTTIAMHQLTAITSVSNAMHKNLWSHYLEKMQASQYMIRDELAEQYNFDNVDELTINKVVDYYAIQEIDNAQNNSHSAMVKYPLHASS